MQGGCTPEGTAHSGRQEEFGYGENGADNSRALGFYGVGIRMENCNRVVLRNFRLSGFDIGLLMQNCENITIENCDFTGCFHDPDWGWDEHGRHGGIVMLHTHNSTICGCTAQHVWDALYMGYSNGNTVKNNLFSHTSNTGLSLWNASENLFEDNDFSYGIRISPGEVHARDSSSVLIESGSNNNIFRRNDMTHGGDGLFIRVLNGWMSTGNLFEYNDCSYANNNAVEAWADRNTYIGNKANHSSYGFWLGNSDATVMIGNEAAYNGLEMCNAPESFGNAGIAIVNGSGSHNLLQANYVHHNGGPGIAIRNTVENPSFHLILQNNRIEHNQNRGRYSGHGIYLKNAKWPVLAGNQFEGNQGQEICLDGNVADVVLLPGGNGQPPVVELDAPAGVVAGEAVCFEARVSEGIESLRWDFDDGTVAAGARVEHTFRAPGLYRVGVTGDDGKLASLAYENMYVLPAGRVQMPDPSAVNVSGDSAEGYIVQRCGGEAVGDRPGFTVTARSGKGHLITAEFASSLPLNPGQSLYFFMNFRSETAPDWSKAFKYPVLRLVRDGGDYITLTPKQPFCQTLFAADNEVKDNGWLLNAALDGSGDFYSEITGNPWEGVNRVEIQCNTFSSGISIMEFGAFCLAPTPGASQQADLAKATPGKQNVVLEQGVTDKVACPEGVLPPQPLRRGDITPRLLFDKGGFYGCRFGAARPFNWVKVYFYENHTKTENAFGESLPQECWLELEADGKWQEIEGTRRPGAAEMVFSLKEEKEADALRVCFTGSSAGPVALCGFGVQHSCRIALLAQPQYQEAGELEAVEVLLNIENNEDGPQLGNLTAELFEVNAEGQPGKSLWKKEIDKELVKPYQPLRMEIGLEGLQAGARYALALGQTSMALSRTEGSYYRWICHEAGYDAETCGIYTEGGFAPSDYNWGTGWLMADCNGVWADYSHQSEHVGARFGLVDIPSRFMTFTLPSKAKGLTDGVVDPENGFFLPEGSSLVLRSEQKASRLRLWGEGECRVQADGVEQACSLKKGVYSTMPLEGVQECRIIAGRGGLTLWQCEAYN